MNAYELGSDKTRVGIITYGSKPMKNIGVLEGISNSTIENALKNAKPIGGKRSIVDVLKFAESGIFREISDKEKGMLLVLMVAGSTEMAAGDELKLAVDELKRLGIEIMIIGLGNEVVTENLKGVVKANMIKHVSNMESIKAKLTDVVEISEKISG